MSNEKSGIDFAHSGEDMSALLNHIESLRQGNGNDSGNNEEPSWLRSAGNADGSDAEVIALLAYSYEMMKQTNDALVREIEENALRFTYIKKPISSCDMLLIPYSA